MSERLSSKEYQAKSSKTKRNKYGAKRTLVDGILFDSKAEASYYSMLKMREKAGEVSAVELQRPFSLLGPKGELICTYKADFCFWDHKADKFRVVDVKGVETAVFKLKRKMMKILLGIEVETTK